MLHFHLNALYRTLFRANPAPLAVIQIFFIKNLARGILFLARKYTAFGADPGARPAGYTFFMIDDRNVCPPIAGFIFVAGAWSDG
jgi:hypothetical protein